MTIIWQSSAWWSQFFIFWPHLMHLSSIKFIFLLKYNNLHNSISIEFMTIFKAKISKKLPKRPLFKQHNCHKTEYWRWNISISWSFYEYLMKNQTLLCHKALVWWISYSEWWVVIGHLLRNYSVTIAPHF